MIETGWTSEWPTENCEVWAYHPTACDEPLLFNATDDGDRIESREDRAWAPGAVWRGQNDGRWRFHPVSRPAPPKE